MTPPAMALRKALVPIKEVDMCGGRELGITTDAREPHERFRRDQIGSEQQDRFVGPSFSHRAPPLGNGYRRAARRERPITLA